MPGCMAWSKFDHDRAVAKDVIVLAVEQFRLTLFQIAKQRHVRSGWAWCPPCVFCEHRIALDLLYDPSRAGERIGVCCVIAVVVRECQICDVCGCIADRSKLRQQGLGDGECALCCGTRSLKVFI